MRFQVYLFFVVHLIFCIVYRILKVEALVGENVRLAEENEFPFVVAIARYLFQDEMQVKNYCGGSLISRKDVLTSEHCLQFEHLNQVHIIAGSSYLDEGLRFYPLWWITYDQWADVHHDEDLFEINDIAIIDLIQRVPTYIIPAHIHMSSIPQLYGRQLQIAGWGLIQNNTIPNSLRTGTVTVLTKEDCEQRISRLANRPIESDDRSFCSAADPYLLSRPGDSGNPVFINNLLVGVNFGTTPFITRSFHPETVNLHMHIHFYYDFISDLRSDY